MSYLSQAHARFAHAIAESKPPELGIFNSPDTFEHDAVQHVEAIFSAFIEYTYTLASELHLHGINVNPSYLTGALSDAVGDLSGALKSHAYDMREPS
jgi:hypothetical protein